MSSRIGRWRRERGAALLLAVLVAAVVVPLAIEVAFLSRVEGSVSARAAAETDRRLLARSAVDVARAVLAADRSDLDHLGEAWAEPIEWEVEGYRIRLTIEDEGRRFPVNAVVRPDRTLSIARKAALAGVLRRAGLGAATADVIVDWIDPDDAPLPNGAEAAAYASMDPPRRPANRPILSPAEFGRMAGLDRRAAERAAEILTPWGAQINVNTVPQEVLEGIGLPPVVAERIVGRRGTRPIGRWEDLVALVGVPEREIEAIRPLVDVRSPFVRVTAQVRRAGASGDEVPFAVEAVLDRTAGGTAVYWREG